MWPIDAGCEYELYAADVTRTFVNDKVHPARFPALIRQLGRLALRDKLPGNLEPRERILARADDVFERLSNNTL